MTPVFAGSFGLLIVVSTACAGIRFVPEAAGPGTIEQRRRLQRPDQIDDLHRQRVNAMVASIDGLAPIITNGQWVPAEATEPGTYEGTAPPGRIDGLLDRTGAFTRGQPSNRHRQHVGPDAIEFRHQTDFFQWASLHVVVSPATGRFVAHIDRFNPDDGPLWALLHWLFDVLPK